MLPYREQIEFSLFSKDRKISLLLLPYREQRELSLFSKDCKFSLLLLPYREQRERSLFSKDRKFSLLLLPYIEQREFSLFSKDRKISLLLLPYREQRELSLFSKDRKFSLLLLPYIEQRELSLFSKDRKFSLLLLPYREQRELSYSARIVRFLFCCYLIESMGLKFCKTFISSISLLLDIASSNLIQHWSVLPEAYCTTILDEIFGFLKVICLHFIISIQMTLPHFNVEHTCEGRTIFKQNNIGWGEGRKGDERSSYFAKHVFKVVRNKNLKILIINNFSCCHVMITKLCTVVELGNT